MLTGTRDNNGYKYWTNMRFYEPARRTVPLDRRKAIGVPKDSECGIRSAPDIRSSGQAD